MDESERGICLIFSLSYRKFFPKCWLKNGLIEHIRILSSNFLDEFSPGNASSDDDEETIAKEEEQDASDNKEEILALQKESEMDLDDLDFLSDYLKNRDKIVLSEPDDNRDENDDVYDDNSHPPLKMAKRGRYATKQIEEESNVRYFVIPHIYLFFCKKVLGF